MGNFKSDPNDVDPSSLPQRTARARRTAKRVLAALKQGGMIVVEMVEGRPSAKLEGDERELTQHCWNTIRPALVPAGDGLFQGTSQTYRHPEGAKQ
jgi:hypothetical protein